MFVLFSSRCGFHRCNGKSRGEHENVWGERRKFIKYNHLVANC